MYGSNFYSNVTGNAHSFSSDSTTGLIIIIFLYGEFSFDSNSIDLIIEMYVLPVPAGPDTNVISFLSNACHNCS